MFTKTYIPGLKYIMQSLLRISTLYNESYAGVGLPHRLASVDRSDTVIIELLLDVVSSDFYIPHASITTK